MNRLSKEELMEKREQAIVTQTVNPDTFLSTDYLNHYNEVIMLIDMLPTMPDVIEMIMEWQPKSYIEHFHDSNLPRRNTAIELYEYAPKKLKLQYETTVNKIDYFLIDALNRLIKIDVVKDQEELADILKDFSEIHKYVSILSNTVNGQIVNMNLVPDTDITELDSLFGHYIFEEYDDEELNWDIESFTLDQDDIDALFD